MKKIMLTATALIFATAMFAQTGTAAPAAAPAKQTTAKPAATSTPAEKPAAKKGGHHKGKAHPKK